MTAWIVVLVVGAGSYLFRLSMIVAADRIRLPAQFDHAAAFVAPAAFAALATTSVVHTVLRSAGVATAIPPLAAVAVAVVAVRLSRSAYAAVLAGMPTLWVTSVLLQVN